MSRPVFSTRTGRLSLWLGGAALALFAFVRITREYIEGDVGAMDRTIVLAVARMRTPWLTITAIDVTALGSITLVILFSAFTLVVLLVLRDRLVRACSYELRDIFEFRKGAVQLADRRAAAVKQFLANRSLGARTYNLVRQGTVKR